jgi:outer membrane protein assembly factor BamE (lipoprotein component of BamABCDE complex)
MRQLLLVPVLLLLATGCGQSPGDKAQAGRLKQDRTAWRKLTKGMTPDQVRALLGEPLRVEQQGEAT